MSNQQANLLMAPAATVEVKSYIGINNLEMPHTFLEVTDIHGNVYDFGFAPQVAGLPLSPGEIYNDASHPFTNSSGSITLSADQGIQLQQYINASITIPPVYSIVSNN